MWPIVWPGESGPAGTTWGLFMQSHHQQPASVLSYKHGIISSRGDRWRRRTWIPVIVRLVTGKLSVSYIPPLIKDYHYSVRADWARQTFFSMWSHPDCLWFLWFARTITILDFNDTKSRQRRRCDINHYRGAWRPTLSLKIVSQKQFLDKNQIWSFMSLKCSIVTDL